MARIFPGLVMLHIWDMRCMRMEPWSLIASVKEQNSLRIVWASEKPSNSPDQHKYWKLSKPTAVTSTGACSWICLVTKLDNSIDHGSLAPNLFGISLEAHMDILLTIFCPVGNTHRVSQTLLSSPRKEVARVSGGDSGSNTGKNILNISLETKLDPLTCPMYKIKEFLFWPAQVPENDI